MLAMVCAASVILPLPGRDGRIAGIPSVCPFYAITGLPCPGCGLTRAFVCLAHGHWQESLHWHPAGWLVALVFLAIWARSAVTAITGRRVLAIGTATSRRLSFLAASLLIAADAARILWLSANHLHF